MTREELLKQAKPILFNTEMVKAILEGRKTVTRRVVKGDTEGLYAGSCALGAGLFCAETHLLVIGPSFHVGDYLYVRETWSDHYVPDEDGKAKLEYCYKTDGINLMAECLPGETNRWYPSIHMPKEAARIFLKVTGVRVERLQDMEEEDAIKEGIHPKMCPNCTGIDCDICSESEYTVMDEFMYLWNSTIKTADLNKYGWDANPWVWVIEFERVEV